LEANIKICFVSASLYSLPKLTGIEVLLKHTLKELTHEEGHEIFVITTGPHRSTKRCIGEIDGVKVYSFYPLNIFERSTASEHSLPLRLIYHAIDHIWNPHPYHVIRDILREEKPDVVHVHNWRGLSPSVFDAVKSLGIPLVLHVHDYVLICPKSSLLRRSGEICAKQPPLCKLYKAIKSIAVGGKPDLVIGNSQFVIDQLRESGFFKDIPAAKLYSAIELENIEYVEKNYEVIDVLFSGRLHSSKGVEILIDAFRQIKHEGIRLHIAGGGPEEKKLKIMAEGDSRIVFYGYLPVGKLEELYKKANITVVPSVWHEPFGIITIESFKYGTPVLGSNMGGIPELIEDNQNGLLFEAGNTDQLKDKLESLINNPAELRRLSLGAFESVKRFDIKHHVAELLKFYKEVINERQDTAGRAS